MDIIISARGTVGALAQVTKKMAFNQSCYGIRANEKVNSGYLFFVLKEVMQNLKDIATGSKFKSITTDDFEMVKIPLPPLDIQEQIVAECEKVDAEYNTSRMSIEEYKKKIAHIFEKIESISVSFSKRMKIGDLAKEIFAGGDLPKERYSLEKTDKYTIPIFANAIQNDGLYGYTDIAKVTEKCLTISARGTIGFTKVRTEPFYPIVRLLVLIPKTELVEYKYLEYAIGRVDMKKFGANIPQLTVPQISDFQIPVPPLSEQKKIVAEIEGYESKIAEAQALMDSAPERKKRILEKYLK
jgi:type I restriction enzyme M protein